jgi:hypothetical protein
MPPETVEAYTGVLRSLDFDDCCQACRVLVVQTKWLPAVSEIVTETRRVTRHRNAEAERLTAELEQAEYDRRAVPPPIETLAAMRRLGLPQETTTKEEGHHEA